MSLHRTVCFRACFYVSVVLLGLCGTSVCNFVGPRRQLRRQLWAVYEQFAPIRMEFDTGFLGKDLEFDCQSEGHVAKIGKPKSPYDYCVGYLQGPRGVTAKELSDCWYKCTYSDVLTDETWGALRNAAGDVSAWFWATLKVQPMAKRLEIDQSRECAKHFTEGKMLGAKSSQDSDLYIVLTARPAPDTATTSSLVCERNAWGRPVVAMLNINPAFLTSLVLRNKVDVIQKLLLHEVTHVLGFSLESFRFFLDDTMRVRQSVVARDYDDGKGVYGRVVTPRVLEAMKWQYHDFHAHAFAGMEVEVSSNGTLEPHWRTDVAGNEIMAPTVGSDSVYSAITLALLEDSGWYVVNYSNAQPLSWGRGQGRHFANNPCWKWPAGPYNCREGPEYGCTTDHRGIGMCVEATREMTGQLLVGGEEQQCAVYQQVLGGSCQQTPSPGVTLPFTADQPVAQQWGEDSGCFMSTLAASAHEGQQLPHCFNFTCTEEGMLAVNIGDTWVECPPGGGDVSLEGYAGRVSCPRGSVLCPVVQPGCPDRCSGHGSCVEGKCECWDGWSGAACNRRTCANNCSGRGECVNGECSCAYGFTGIDCSSGIPTCSPDCFAQGKFCYEGRCETPCSGNGFVCTNGSSVKDHLSYCGHLFAGRTMCLPDSPKEIRRLEATKVENYMYQLSPAGPWDIGSNACQMLISQLACYLVFRECPQHADVRLPVCADLCRAYNLHCSTYLSSVIVLCEDHDFRDTGDGNACSGDNSQTRGLDYALHQAVMFVVFLTGLTFFFWAFMRLAQHWDNTGWEEEFRATNGGMEGPLLNENLEHFIESVQARWNRLLGRSSDNGNGNAGDEPAPNNGNQTAAGAPSVMQTPDIDAPEAMPPPQPASPAATAQVHRSVLATPAAVDGAIADGSESSTIARPGSRSGWSGATSLSHRLHYLLFKFQQRRGERLTETEPEQMELTTINRTPAGTEGGAPVHESSRNGAGRAVGSAEGSVNEDSDDEWESIDNGSSDGEEAGIPVSSAAPHAGRGVRGDGGHICGTPTDGPDSHDDAFGKREVVLSSTMRNDDFQTAVYQDLPLYVPVELPEDMDGAAGQTAQPHSEAVLRLGTAAQAGPSSSTAVHRKYRQYASLPGKAGQDQLHEADHAAQATTAHEEEEDLRSCTVQSGSDDDSEVAVIAVARDASASDVSSDEEERAVESVRRDGYAGLDSGKGSKRRGRGVGGSNKNYERLGDDKDRGLQS